MEEDFTALHLTTSPKSSEKDYVPEEEVTASIRSSCHSHRGTCEVRRCCDSRRIDQTDLVYIYITYESIAKFSPRVSADGHILVQETIPFDSFDAVWYYDWKEEKDYYRLMITKGKDQIVLSVQGARKVATIERFDKLIGNIVPDESSPDLNELRKLVDIKTGHFSHSHRLFPGHPDWNDAISLLAVTHRPSKEDHRLCPACLCETPASLSICVVCKGFLVSHGWRKRIKDHRGYCTKR